MSRFSPLTKRRAFIALFCAVPLRLFAVIWNIRQWQPRILPFKTVPFPDGPLLWMSDSKTLLVQVGDSLQFWNTTTQTLSRSFKGQLFAELHILSKERLAFVDYDASDKGETISTLQIEDSTTAKILSSLQTVGVWRFSADRQRFCAVKEVNGSLEIETYQSNPIRSIRKTVIKPPRNLAFNQIPTLSITTFPTVDWELSHDVKTVIVPCTQLQNKAKEAGILLCDAQTGKRRAFIPIMSLPTPHVLHSSRDGKTLIISGQGKCQLWDMLTGKQIKSWQSPTFKGVAPCRLSSSAQHWLYGYGYGGKSVFIWDATTGKLLREIKVYKGISEINLSPDERTLAIATTNGDIKLYRMR